jgi:hypothetical protein
MRYLNFLPVVANIAAVRFFDFNEKPLDKKFLNFKYR